MTTTDELIDEYRVRAEPLGVRVERVADVVAAAELVRALADEIGTDGVVIAPALNERAAGLIAAIEHGGLATRLGTVPAEVREAPLGISLAERAIAETGSVLLVERDLADRSVSLVTLTHITICPISALVASLDDAVDVLRQAANRPGGGYATFVTGPSRTADIELTLTVGVQGPGHVMVLFVDDLS